MYTPEIKTCQNYNKLLIRFSFRIYAFLFFQDDTRSMVFLQFCNNFPRIIGRYYEFLVEVAQLHVYS